MNNANNPILVSIMMPVYNGLPLIKASVESLINQTYQNWECIVIDDGSVDGTSQYLDTIVDPRFKIYHQENMGRPVARQRALDIASGKYLAMLDAGDLYHPQKIERQVSLLESRPEISLVTTSICSFGTHHDNIYIRGVKVTTDKSFDGSNHPIHAPSLLRMKRAKLCNYNPKLRLGEDQDFLEKYLVVGDVYMYLSDVYYYYSELDSVSKEKIRKNYFLYAVKYFRESKYKMSLIFTLKYFYSLIVFPFVSIDKLLSQRGCQPTDEDLEQYIENCKSLVDKCI